MVAYGASVARLARGGGQTARAKQVSKRDLIRPITLWPFPGQEVREALPECKSTFCAWRCRMGQMIDDVNLAVDCRASGAVLLDAPAASSRRRLRCFEQIKS